MIFLHILQKHSIIFANFSKPVFRLNFSTSHLQTKIMGDMNRNGLPLKTIVQYLEEFAPSNTAEGWDNTGLLVDPMESSPIKKILLTNDLTEAVMDEAINLKVGMILSYHPPIFKGLKTLTTKTWKERIIIQSLKYSIAIYSPHSAWDNKENGPNTWLTNCLDPAESAPILESGTGQLCKLKKPLSVKDVIERIKNCIQIPHLRLALAVGKNMDSEISTVAVCVGSGVSVLTGTKADLYLTGEMLHHPILDATHNGTHVILCNHSDSERGYLRSIVSHLQNNLMKNDVEVVMSQKDADPLKTV